MDSQRPRNDILEVGKHILADLPLSMVLTDPNKPDNPISYVNRAFEELSGYSASYAVGQNCRFMQGDDRDQEEVASLRAAIAARESVIVTLRNYRASGEAFLNRLMIAPVTDDEDNLWAFIGIQAEVREPVDVDRTSIRRFDDRLEEMQHRVKNHLQMVASMIRMQDQESRRGGGADTTLARRVEALSLLYDEFSASPKSDGVRYDVVSAGAYVSRVANTLGALEGRRNIRVVIDTDPVYMRTERAAQLGLLVSEILSNTFQHAFEGRREGIVQVSLTQLGGDRVRLSISDDGVGMGETDWPEEGSLGARIVRGLVSQLEAQLKVSTGDGGSVIFMDMSNVLDTSLDPQGERMLADEKGGRTGGATGMVQLPEE